MGCRGSIERFWELNRGQHIVVGVIVWSVDAVCWSMEVDVWRWRS